MIRVLPFVLFVILGLTSSALAQDGVTWSEPFNVSESVTGSAYPAVVTDDYGYVHVFWTEDMGGSPAGPDDILNSGNTILYRRWDGQDWTQPLDIIAVPREVYTSFVAATLDDNNQLHLVWTGVSDTYYSSAPAADAYSVKAWSEPEVISAHNARTRYEQDIVVDSQGTIHVVFATGGDLPGVYHIMSPSDSSGWSFPVRIADVLRASEVAFKDVRLVVDELDHLHAVWATANEAGFSRAVYYARSEQTGEAWEPAVMMADSTIENSFVSWPKLLALGKDELLLIHADQYNDGRIERTSDDGGKTWSEPRLILASMEGINGFLTPLVDSAGDLHLVINMRPKANQQTGIYHAPATVLGWAPIDTVAAVQSSARSAHNTDAEIRLGSEIHVVWEQHRGSEIWHIKGVINDLQPLPAFAIPAVAQPAGEVTSVPEMMPEAAVVAENETERRLPDELTAEPAQTQSAMPIAVAIALVLLFVSGILFWRLRMRRV